MKHTEMIMVIEAHSEGKAIQCALKARNDWSIIESPEFNFMVNDYRVKPKPVYKVINYGNVPASLSTAGKYVEIKALEVALDMLSPITSHLIDKELETYNQLKELL